MSRKVLGIDIRNTSVAAVLVESGLREKRITAHAHRPISGAEDFQSGLRAALQSLAEEIDPAGCDCVVAISADHFSYRNLRIPFKNAKKIQMVLPFELEPILPYPADELVIDFILLGTTGQGDQSEVFAVALSNQRLRPFVEALSAIHVDPEIVTVGGLPAALYLAAQADPGEDRLALELGRHYSTLFVIAGSRVELIRSFATAPVGADRATTIGTVIRHTLIAHGESVASEFDPLDLVITGKGEMNIVDLLIYSLEVKMVRVPRGFCKKVSVVECSKSIVDILISSIEENCILEKLFVMFQSHL